MRTEEVQIRSRGVLLEGTLTIPWPTAATVLFAHGSGSSRRSPRNQKVAAAIQAAGIATLLFDLLTQEEEELDRYTAELRFDVNLLANRLEDATEWLVQRSDPRGVTIGYFGASTGAAAALIAAAHLRDRIHAVVSRGGRPDLAGPLLPEVVAPTLLIVGGLDEVVIELNEQAYARLRCEKQLVIVPGATHLFEEPGALEQVADLAVRWFVQHLLKEGAIDLSGGAKH